MNNTDDLEVRRLADTTTTVEVVRYGIDAAGLPHVTATDVDVTAAGASFTITDSVTLALWPCTPGFWAVTRSVTCSLG